MVLRSAEGWHCVTISIPYIAILFKMRENFFMNQGPKGYSDP